MGIWESYENRITVNGNSKREAILNRELHMLGNKLSDTLSYQNVMINNISCNVAIVSSDNLYEKIMFSTDKNTIKGGEVVEWLGNRWLVVECDSNSEVYTKATLSQCNHLLKWIDANSVLHEQWCVIKDGTKFSIGESEDGNFVVTHGDSRIAMTISKNEDTIKFCRESRFLIDDPESTEKLSYLLTKPLKVGMVYNNYGVYSFILKEVVSTDDDNHELGIANYYKHFPRKTSRADTSDNKEKPTSTEINKKKVWL